MLATAWTEVTAPTTEPITTEEVKDHLRITHGHEDQRIERYAKTARRLVEEWTRRQLVTATYDVWYDCYPSRGDVLQIPRPPLQSVTTVKYIDTDGNQQTESSSVYTVDTDSEPGLVYLAPDQSWSSIQPQRKAVEVRVVCGYGAAAAVPDKLLDLLLFLTEHFYDLGDDGPKADRLPQAIETLKWSCRAGAL